MNKKIVIGLAGMIASGKDTVADYVVKKYDGQSVSFSQPLRDILNRIFLPINRINLSKLAQTLVDNFGGDVLSYTITEEIKKNPKQIFILPNIRRESDYACLIKEPSFDFYLVGLNTDMRTCYDRLITRGQNVDDKSKTWEDFQKDLLLSTEVGIADLVKKSTHQLSNNSSLEDLYKSIDNLIVSLTK
jgi:dephospho-CoA kinase